MWVQKWQKLGPCCTQGLTTNEYDLEDIAACSFSFKFQIAHVCNRIFIFIIMYTALYRFLKYIFIQFGTVRKEKQHSLSI